MVLGALCPPSPQWPAFNSCCYASYDPLSCLSFNQLNEEGACRTAVGLRCCGWGAVWLLFVCGARRCGVFWFSCERHDALLRIAARLCLTGLRDTELSSRLRSLDAAILGQAALAPPCLLGLRFAVVLWRCWGWFGVGLPLPFPLLPWPALNSFSARILDLFESFVGSAGSPRPSPYGRSATAGWPGRWSLLLLGVVGVSVCCLRGQVMAQQGRSLEECRKPWAPGLGWFVWRCFVGLVFGGLVWRFLVGLLVRWFGLLAFCCRSFLDGIPAALGAADMFVLSGPILPPALLLSKRRTVAG